VLAASAPDVVLDNWRTSRCRCPTVQAAVTSARKGRGQAPRRAFARRGASPQRHPRPTRRQSPAASAANEASVARSIRGQRVTGDWLVSRGLRPRERCLSPTGMSPTWCIDIRDGRAADVRLPVLQRRRQQKVGDRHLVGRSPEEEPVPSCIAANDNRSQSPAASRPAAQIPLQPRTSNTGYPPCGNVRNHLRKSTDPGNARFNSPSSRHANRTSPPATSAATISR